MFPPERQPLAFPLVFSCQKKLRRSPFIVNEPCILYLSSCLPKLSETFVYREIFELRALGCNVQTASLHPPDVFPDGTEMQSLALETLVLYSGYPALLCDALLEAIFHPAPAVGTLITVLRDACRETDISPAQRLRLAGQAFAALALARRLRPKHITRIQCAHGPCPHDAGHVYSPSTLHSL